MLSEISHHNAANRIACRTPGVWSRETHRDSGMVVVSFWVEEKWKGYNLEGTKFKYYKAERILQYRKCLALARFWV